MNFYCKINFYRYIKSIKSITFLKKNYSGLISPENTPLEVLSALICSPEPIEL